MDTLSILKHVDHTLLRPDATWAEISRCCEEALEWSCASACIPPAHVAQAHSAFPELKLCTVIGFPLGYNHPRVKLMESEQALLDGADEIDLVVNISAVKARNYDLVTEEIRQIRAQSLGHILKVIVETCYLNQEEKIALCAILSDLGVDYIKTSTGFGSAGAELSDMALFRQHLDSKVKIKASGGIRSLEDMAAFLQAGADRLGTSSAVRLAQSQLARLKP